MNDSRMVVESEKSKRYDRQIRLWGDHGQTALESAHVCLINATATGTEALKSLVLPGIGAFTIIDGHQVTGENVGNNFFLDKDSIGKSRAKVATDLLLELNGEVKGDFVDEHIESMLEVSPNFFQKFSLVIATALTEKSLLLLAEKLWKHNIPLLVCRSYGMIGYMRLQFSEHCIIESHPESDFYDLHLDKPFLTLQQYVESIDLEKLNNKDHSHTPFVVILLKYLNQWKADHDGKIPKTAAEKKCFKDEIKKSMRILADGGDEENFQEALKAVNRSIYETKVPPSIKELFEDPLCLNLTAESSPFWIMVKALKEFAEEKGYLPLSGVIPDMTATTESYVKLQTIYRTEAEKNVHTVYSTVQKLLTYLGKPQDLISSTDIKCFCKNSLHLKVLRGTSLKDEYDCKTTKVNDIVVNLDHTDNDIMYYVLLRSVDRFYAEYNRFPGLYSDEVEPDIARLKSCMCRLIQEWGCGPLSRDDYIHEMCRFGGAELHSVAAFIGGCAAQEAIKVITGQFVPFNNTFIYNAITSTTSVFYL